MKKAIWFFVQTVFGLALGLVFYLAYIHVVSLLSIPISIVYGLFISAVLLGFSWILLVNIKDFIVSIFLNDDELVKRGYRKKL